ncbi:ABC transporter ATP-binding protein [Nakamurella silvestris]|nr:ABC transporter ATP-binding protein [Nakamurella silvestris]
MVVDAAVTTRGVDVHLTVAPGEVVAVLGANGAGKSTLLSLVSGSARPDHGRITLDGRPLVDTATGTWVPPHERGVVLLAQQALLFPHMTAVANVAFGPRSRGASRREAQETALSWLAAVDATEFAERRPHQLSGGQAQRVAIARALAAEPVLLLLDEPMAALDVAVAPALRQLLRSVLRGTGRTALFVTHDLVDALSLADRVVVMEDGRIVEDGPARTVLAQPRSSFAARIAGIDLIPGVVTEDGLVTTDGLRVHGQVAVGATIGEAGVAVFRPAAVAVHLTVPTGSPRNHFPVVISELEPRGEIVRVRSQDDRSGGTGGLVADITAASAADLELVPGKRVHFAVKATEVAVHAAASQP